MATTTTTTTRRREWCSASGSTTRREWCSASGSTRRGAGSSASGSGRRGGWRIRAESESEGGDRAQPWVIGEYITKRRKRRTNSLGNIVDADEDFLEPAGWNDDSKLALAVECVARELGVEEDHVRRRLVLLQKLVPDLKPKLKTMKVGDIARLAVKCKTIPHDLLKLKEIFPRANVSRLVASNPTILYEDMGFVEKKAERLKALLKTDDVDRAVELNPIFLDLQQVEFAIEEIKRLMPNEDACVYLIRNPSILYSTQARENIITYDDPYFNFSTSDAKTSSSNENR
ncbi:hypothetical protein HOP50_06g45910 [Chloropicon primus]|uniref:Uncharacterized protein n=2 Tax=Chloropicon primus TaxID=1764295 RepID=A0A5B8MNJ8_9CHLO|nr:hypothetical protein A3770_06p45670 [Chloropicon primus]UPR01269.1 hypothetical protein HOP50_06g45910 [Chloropicon primus]|eukprot:QDZ22049.1 hypothetical protein A3770_06p45670 [Chloropicon primus]